MSGLAGRARPLVLLDRDGVLDREVAGGWLAAPRDWTWEVGAEAGLAALAALLADGGAAAVVTNQSGIGRGVVAAEAVDALHAWLRDELVARGLPAERTWIFACPHAPGDGCRCRKPAPGLLLDALAAAGADPGDAVLVGDARRDLEAAAAVGVAAILVRTGKGRSTEAELGEAAARGEAWATGVAVVDDLAAAVAVIARRALGG